MEIIAQEIEYTYPKTAFSLNVNEFKISAGECVALRGLNGSGKTTLGKLIAGILRPQNGHILLYGEDITKWSLGKTGENIGYLFQEPSYQLFAPIVIEELTFTQELSGIDKDKAIEKAREMLEKFELSSISERSTYILSRGEKQRLAICAMLMNNPKFLILDEPTTGLDIRRRETLGSLLKNLVSEGIGILLISHDDEFIESQAHRSVFMMEGSIHYG